jgi:hypothetical protein
MDNPCCWLLASCNFNHKSGLLKLEFEIQGFHKVDIKPPPVRVFVALKRLPKANLFKKMIKINAHLNYILKYYCGLLLKCQRLSSAYYSVYFK